MRRKLTDTTHPDESLTDQYWLKFGDIPQPPMREKMMYLTMAEVSKVGPGAFNSATVCDRLGVTYPMVNHYFGSRDGLLAETAFEVYRRYISSLWQAVARAPREPKARLAAWMREQVERTAEMGGWGAVLNYPYAAMNVSALLETDYHDDIQLLFESNVARLAVLVRDVKNNTVTALPETVSAEFRRELAADRELMALGSSVAWSTLGVAVWNSGQHLPSAKIDELQAARNELIEAHIRHVIESI